MDAKQASSESHWTWHNPLAKQRARDSSTKSIAHCPPKVEGNRDLRLDSRAEIVVILGLIVASDNRSREIMLSRSNPPSL